MAAAVAIADAAAVVSQDVTLIAFVPPDLLSHRQLGGSSSGGQLKRCLRKRQRIEFPRR